MGAKKIFKIYSSIVRSLPPEVTKLCNGEEDGRWFNKTALITYLLSNKQTLQNRTQYTRSLEGNSNLETAKKIVKMIKIFSHPDIYHTREEHKKDEKACYCADRMYKFANRCQDTLNDTEELSDVSPIAPPLFTGFTILDSNGCSELEYQACQSLRANLPLRN